jgi:hypothetical protein
MTGLAYWNSNILFVGDVVSNEIGFVFSTDCTCMSRVVYLLPTHANYSDPSGPYFR